MYRANQKPRASDCCLMTLTVKTMRFRWCCVNANLFLGTVHWGFFPPREFSWYQIYFLLTKSFILLRNVFSSAWVSVLTFFLFLFVWLKPTDWVNQWLKVTDWRELTVWLEITDRSLTDWLTEGIWLTDWLTEDNLLTDWLLKVVDWVIDWR